MSLNCHFDDFFKPLTVLAVLFWAVFCDKSRCYDGFWRFMQDKSPFAIKICYTGQMVFMYRKFFDLEKSILPRPNDFDV